MYSNSVDRKDYWFHTLFCSLYLMGSIMFVVGSILLYSNFSDLVNSARLYTLGSFAFVLTDAMDWYYARKQTSSLNGLITQGRFSRIICFNNVLSFTSILGSVFYLIGSIFFLHEVNLPRSSLQGFLVASVLIMLAQAVKIYRTICIRADNQTNHATEKELFDGTDSSPLIVTVNRTMPPTGWELLSGVLLDSFIFAGALCFLIGSYDGLHQTSPDVMADLFTVGSVFYLLAGMLTGYQHCCRSESR